MTIQEQNFGVEIEFTGITRYQAAKVVARYFNSTPYHDGGTYDKYSILDTNNRKWTIVYDSSISCTSTSTSTSNNNSRASNKHSCELVTPICNYNDIEDLQQIVRNLKSAGARTNSSCGIHIHINGAPHTSRSLRNIANIIYSKEDILIHALDIDYRRQSNYCKKTEKAYVDRINTSKLPSIEEQKTSWYNGRDGSNSHYHNSRYHMLNLHSYFSKGTIEFRLFNSTLHAGKIKAYTQFCLAVSAQAINQKSSRAVVTTSTNECYTFRTWLIRIGLNGDEFKTCRLHLLSNLQGAKDWKDKAAAMERRAQRATELARDINQNQQRNEAAVTSVIETHRQRRTGTMVNSYEHSNNEQLVLSITERVDAFLADVSGDVTVTDEERNNILNVLLGNSNQNVNENQNRIALPRNEGRRI